MARPTKQQTGMVLAQGPKRSFKLTMVDFGPAPPTRAKLDRRAAWAAAIVRRLREGLKCRKADLDLALQWMDEAARELAARAGR